HEQRHREMCVRRGLKKTRQETHRARGSRSLKTAQPWAAQERRCSSKLCRAAPSGVAFATRTQAQRVGAGKPAAPPKIGASSFSISRATHSVGRPGFLQLPCATPTYAIAALRSHSGPLVALSRHATRGWDGSRNTREGSSGGGRY